MNGDSGGQEQNNQGTEVELVNMPVPETIKIETKEVEIKMEPKPEKKPENVPQEVVPEITTNIKTYVRDKDRKKVMEEVDGVETPQLNKMEKILNNRTFLNFVIVLILLLLSRIGSSYVYGDTYDDSNVDAINAVSLFIMLNLVHS